MCYGEREECVFMPERERGRVCVYVKERERERVCVCMFNGNRPSIRTHQSTCKQRRVSKKGTSDETIG